MSYVQFGQCFKNESTTEAEVLESRMQSSPSQGAKSSPIVRLWTGAMLFEVISSLVSLWAWEMLSRCETGLSFPSGYPFRLMSVLFLWLYDITTRLSHLCNLKAMLGLGAWLVNVSSVKRLVWTQVAKAMLASVMLLDQNTRTGHAQSSH